MSFYKYFMIGLVLLLAMPIVGCANSSKTGLALEAELKALRETRAATTEVQSYRVEVSSTYTEGGETLESTLELEFVAPDRYHWKACKNGDWEESIIIGDKVYSRGSDNDQWREVELSPNVLEAQRSSLKASIPSAENTLRLLDSLTDLRRLPDEKIDGIDCLHCCGRVDMDRKVEKEKAEMMATLDPSKPGYQERLKSHELMWGWQRKWEIDYELWISREDCLVRQQRYEMEMPAMESPTGEIMQGEMKGAMLMHYYDINEPINIKPPKMLSEEAQQ